MDQRLRELERTARTDARAAAFYLAELLRSGHIERRTVELGAHLGHVPSLGALGLRHVELKSADDLHDWTAALLGWSKQIAVLAAVVSGDVGVRAWEHSGGGPAPRFALEAARTWAEHPCPEHQRACSMIARRFGSLGGTANGNTGTWACWAASHDWPELVAREVGYAATCAVHAARSVAAVQSAISRVLLTRVLAGIPVPLTAVNRTKPPFASWTITD